MIARLIEGIRSIRRRPKKTLEDSLPEDGRNSARVVGQLPVLCSSDLPWFRAIIADLNRIGMRLETQATVFKGQRFWISFQESPSQALALYESVEVEVAWTRKKAVGGCTAGVRFRAPDRLAGTWVQLVLWEAGMAGLADLPQRRRQIRLAGKIRADVLNEAGDYLTQAEATNLSLGGLQLKSEHSLNEGQDVKVKLTPDRGLPSFTVGARVLRIRRPGNSAWHFISLRFNQIHPVTFTSLKLLVTLLVKSHADQ